MTTDERYQRIRRGKVTFQGRVIETVEDAKAAMLLKIHHVEIGDVLILPDKKGGFYIDQAVWGYD